MKNDGHPRHWTVRSAATGRFLKHVHAEWTDDPEQAYTFCGQRFAETLAEQARLCNIPGLMLSMYACPPSPKKRRWEVVDENDLSFVIKIKEDGRVLEAKFDNERSARYAETHLNAALAHLGSNHRVKVREVVE